MLNFDRSTVKHGTQNIQNDCDQWLSEVHQIRFRPVLCPGLQWGGGLQRSPDPLAGLRSPASKGEGETRKRRKGEKKVR